MWNVNISGHNAKNFAWKFCTVTEKSEKNEMISLSYVGDDHVCLLQIKICKLRN